MRRSSRGSTAGCPRCPTGELEVRDLASTNGTFVNGTRVEIARLSSGDRLKIGRVELLATRELD